HVGLAPQAEENTGVAAAIHTQRAAIDLVLDAAVAAPSRLRLELQRRFAGGRTDDLHVPGRHVDLHPGDGLVDRDGVAGTNEPRQGGQARERHGRESGQGEAPAYRLRSPVGVGDSSLGGHGATLDLRRAVWLRPGDEGSLIRRSGVTLTAPLR